MKGVPYNEYPFVCFVWTYAHNCIFCFRSTFWIM